MVTYSGDEIVVLLIIFLYDVGAKMAFEVLEHLHVMHKHNKDTSKVWFFVNK